jgi:hypothetical protein
MGEVNMTTEATNEIQEPQSIPFNIMISSTHVRAFVRQRLRWSLLAISLMSAVIATLLVRYAVRLSTPWLCVVAAATFTLCFWLTMARHERRAIKNVFRSVPDPVTVAYRLDGFGVASSGELGRGHVSWQTFSKLRRGPVVWDLHQGSDIGLVFPANQLSDEVKAFMVEQVARHGGKVT